MRPLALTILAAALCGCAYAPTRREPNTRAWCLDEAGFDRAAREFCARLFPRVEHDRLSR